MRFPAAKLIATVVCSLSLLGAAVQPAQACCFLNCLFGWCGGPRCGSGCGPGYSSYYGPVYGGGCNSGSCSTGSCGTTYYAPSSCSSCASTPGCSTCGGDPYASSSCPDGSCAGSTVASPINEPEWRRPVKKGNPTYGPNDPDSGPLGGSGSDGTGNGSRTKTESGLDAKPDNLNDADDTRAFKPPRGGQGSGIEQAGAESNLHPSTPVNPKGGKKGPRTPAFPDDDEKDKEDGNSRLPTLNLDEKVAWRPAPERKRVELTRRVANARLIRVPAYPNSGWVPETPESKIAKK